MVLTLACLVLASISARCRSGDGVNAADHGERLVIVSGCFGIRMDPSRTVAREQRKLDGTVRIIAAGEMVRENSRLFLELVVGKRLESSADDSVQRSATRRK